MLTQAIKNDRAGHYGFTVNRLSAVLHYFMVIEDVKGKEKFS